MTDAAAAKDSSIRLLTNTVAEEQAKYLALETNANKAAADHQALLDENTALSFEKRLAEGDRDWLWKTALPKVFVYCLLGVFCNYTCVLTGVFTGCREGSRG